jgi:zinc transporter ZupT
MLKEQSIPLTYNLSTISNASTMGINNFPEGIALTASIYAATNSKYKGIRYSFIDGLCEPAGVFVLVCFSII